MRQLARNQIGHGDQIANRSVSPGPSFCSLDDRIGTLHSAVIGMSVEPGQDAAPMTTNGSGGILHRLQATTDCPVVPALQALFGFGNCLALLVDLLKRGLDLPGSGRFQTAFRQAVKVFLLPLAPIGFVP